MSNALHTLGVSFNHCVLLVSVVGRLVDTFALLPLGVGDTFIELHNPGNTSMALGGCTVISKSIVTYTLPATAAIGPGEYLLLRSTVWHRAFAFQVPIWHHCLHGLAYVRQYVKAPLLSFVLTGSYAAVRGWKHNAVSVQGPSWCSKSHHHAGVC